MVETVIRGGDVMLPSGLARVDLGIANGQIAVMADPGSAITARETIDATGLLVLPGTIDVHFHCRAPSHPERETFATGTAAAAAGGVTTILEMPISDPAAVNGQVLDDRMALADREAYVDIGFYCGCATLDPADIASGLAAGAIAFKGFMQKVPAGRESEFTGICLPTTAELCRAFELLRDVGVPAVFHAEDEPIYQAITARLIAEGKRDPITHVASRPDYVEALAVSQLLVLADHFGVQLHVPHVSSALTLGLIRDAKRRGVSVTAETCPQYLAFDSSVFERVGPYAKCNPPIKSADDRAALWEGVRDGTIDVITTDHSPFVPADKEMGWTDIWQVLPGFPGVEGLTGFVIGAALDGKLDLARASALISANGAGIFGLTPRKGTLQLGADADITLYDPTVDTIVDTTQWMTRGKETARIWDGMRHRGRVVRTILRGRTVMLDGNVTGESGYGRIVRNRQWNMGSANSAG